MEQDTLYYDGACPLCSAEINKLANLSGDGLCLKNIHELDGGEDCPPADVLMSRLHLKTSQGQWITGLSANVHAWQHTLRHCLAVAGAAVDTPCQLLLLRTLVVAAQRLMPARRRLLPVAPTEGYGSHRKYSTMNA